MKNRLYVALLGLTAFTGLVLCSALFGSPIDVPDGDPLVALIHLVMNFKASGPLVIAATVVTILVQGVKRFVPDFKYTLGVTIFGGVLYGILQSLQSGLSLAESLVFIFITSGGATVIYEYFTKPVKTRLEAKK